MLPVYPMHLTGLGAAPRAPRRPARRLRPDHDHVVLVRYILDDQGRQPGEHDSRKFIYVTRHRPCHTQLIAT
jgi:hypothetical protein